MGRRDVVQMRVLSLGYHVNLLGVILRESATPKQQPEREGDGIEEASQLGEDEDQGRADRGGLPGGDQIWRAVSALSSSIRFSTTASESLTADTPINAAQK